MAKCSKCGASVPEQKAFCPECGAPMSAQAAERKQSAADLGATVIVPPSKWNAPPATGGTAPKPTHAATPPATSAPAATPTRPPTSAPPVATPTRPPVTDTPRGSNMTVWLLVGAIVLLIVIIAFMLLRR